MLRFEEQKYQQEAKLYHNADNIVKVQVCEVTTGFLPNM